MTFLSKIVARNGSDELGGRRLGRLVPSWRPLTSNFQRFIQVTGAAVLKRPSLDLGAVTPFDGLNSFFEHAPRDATLAKLRQNSRLITVSTCQLDGHTCGDNSRNHWLVRRIRWLVIYDLKTGTGQELSCHHYDQACHWHSDLLTFRAEPQSSQFL